MSAETATEPHPIARSRSASKRIPGNRWLPRAGLGNPAKAKPNRAPHAAKRASAHRGPSHPKASLPNGAPRAQAAHRALPAWSCLFPRAEVRFLIHHAYTFDLLIYSLASTSFAVLIDQAQPAGHGARSRNQGCGSISPFAFMVI